MRLNQYLANFSHLSRRQADAEIIAGRVMVNGQPAQLGQSVMPTDRITLANMAIDRNQYIYLALHKPVGYVCSRRQQGTSPTIYDLLPPEYHHLKSVGRLDRDSSGLLVLTNDGTFANQLLHPRYGKTKLYRVVLNRTISDEHIEAIQRGVELDDGISKMQVKRHSNYLLVTISQGRNRQIRRTFKQLGYTVVTLERLAFGRLRLDHLKTGKSQLTSPEAIL
jgi:23S rRNA pseudouridine2605 synthase